MKKILILASIIVIGFLTFGCNAPKEEGAQMPERESQEIRGVEAQNIEDGTDILLTMNEKSSAQNQIWVGTFQLAWNDLLETFNKGEPVTLLPEMPKSAVELNKKMFSKEYISEDSYYINHGPFISSFVEKMSKDIYKKFKEKTDTITFSLYF